MLAMFLTHDLDILTPKINEFRELVAKHLGVKFGDPNWIGFRDII